MKNFLKKCPLVALSIFSALIVAGFQLIQYSAPLPQASESASSSDASSEVRSQISSAAPLPSSSKPVAKPEVPSRAAGSSSVPEQNQSTPLPEKKPFKASGFQKVTADYFSDALFIGDSHTSDLRKYGDLNKASYFSHVGLNIYQLFERPKTDEISGLTLEQTLRKNQYHKIYIMLGINELGTGNTAYFTKHYSSALAKIRELEPNAIIYVQSILYVTAEKSAGDDVFNNKNIRERNSGLKALADNKTVFYLDINSAVDDGHGNLCAKYTGDGVHLKAKYYSLWRDRLLSNAIVIS